MQIIHKQLDCKALGERLKKIRGKETQSDFANKYGLYGLLQTDISRLERGEVANPLIDDLFNICINNKRNLAWLLYGDEPEYQEEQKEVIGKEILPIQQPDDYVYIPLYNLRAAAGYGAINETEEVADVLAFKADWVKTVLRANKSDLFLMYVDGDSMEPTLRPGDIILIDKRDMPVTRDGIYVLKMDSILLTKRLQRFPGGIIQVTSDNSVYKPFEIMLDQPASDIDKITIIGRVVWAGRRF